MKFWSILLVVGVVLFILGGCQKGEEFRTKLDPGLKTLLESKSVSRVPNTWVPVLGTARVEITERVRKKMATTGARIGTVAGKLFTADVPMAGIRPLAEMKEIKYLQLAEKAKPTK